MAVAEVDNLVVLVVLEVVVLADFLVVLVAELVAIDFQMEHQVVVIQLEHLVL